MADACRRRMRQIIDCETIVLPGLLQLTDLELHSLETRPSGFEFGSFTPASDFS